MVSKVGSEAFFPSDDQMAKLFGELEEAFTSGSLKDDDPDLKILFQEIFKDNAKFVSLISDFDGKISACIYKAGELGASKAKIQEFVNKALVLKNEMAHELASKSHIEQIKPPVLEFLFDIDAPDHNGAILERLISGLEAGNSVITTRTIFRADKTKKGTRDTYISYDLIPAFKVIKNNYDIYAAGPFLVFIPKNLAKELSAEERLEKLDLKKEEMTKISLAEAWEKRLEESSVKKLRQLFSEHPKQDKVVFIAGHGGVGNPAGMSAKKYQDFLEWIKEQRCQGLLVTSCYSGGESTMLHLQKNEEGKKVQPLNLPFPVMVRSIGDFTSRGAIKAEKNVNTFFSRISELFSSPGGQTLFRLRRAIQEYEKEFGEKSTSNLMQVHFPHSADSPGGFRPVGEGGKSESLTYVKYRKKEVEEGRIVIENGDFLELFPGVVMTPVDVVKKKSCASFFNSRECSASIKRSECQGFYR